MRAPAPAWWLLLIWLALGGVSTGCRPRSAPVVPAAELELTQLISALGDDAYLDPRLDRLAERLRSVPSDSSEAAQAQALLAKLEAESRRVREHEAKLAAALAEARRPTPAPARPVVVAKVEEPPAAPAPPPKPVAAGPRTVSSLPTFPGWRTGVQGYEAAMAEQRSSGCPVLVYFHVGWCKWCKQLDAVVLPNADVAGELATAYKVKIDPEAGETERRLADQFGVRGYPSVLLVAAAGDSPEKLPTGVGETPRPKELSDGYHRRVAHAWAQKAHAALQAGRSDEAIAQADRLVALDPKHSNGYGYQVRASAFRQKGELAEALRDDELGCAAGCSSCCGEKR